DGALLQRGIDVAAGDLLWHHAQSLQDHAGEAANAELQTLEVLERVDLLAEPAPHLAVGGTADEAGDPVLGAQEFIEQLLAATMEEPGILHAAVHAERQVGGKRQGGGLARVVVS